MMNRADFSIAIEFIVPIISLLVNNSIRFSIRLLKEIMFALRSLNKTKLVHHYPIVKNAKNYKIKIKFNLNLYSGTSGSHITL